MRVGSRRRAWCRASIRCSGHQDNILPRWSRERQPAAAEMRQLMDARLREMSGSVLPELRDVDVLNEQNQ